MKPLNQGPFQISLIHNYVNKDNIPPPQSPAQIDYEEILEIIPVDNLKDTVIPVTIIDDLLPEETEYFGVNITTTDDSVLVEQEGTVVFILDNGEEY